jgi:hypothetical protein
VNPCVADNAAVPQLKENKHVHKHVCILLHHVILQIFPMKDSAVEVFPYISFASFSTVLSLPSKGIGPTYAWRRGFGLLGVRLVQSTEKPIPLSLKSFVA